MLIDGGSSMFAFVLLGSTLIPLLWTINPRNLAETTLNAHFNEFVEYCCQMFKLIDHLS